jgi:putative DNA primase/helicase
LASDDELCVWFRDRTCGIAVIAGGVLGNLETLDFETEATFAEWEGIVHAHAPGLVGRLCQVRTPGHLGQPGRHVRYRCPGVTVPGNTELALDYDVDQATGEIRVDGKGKPKSVALIETRGEGGYALAPGSPPGCHETGRTWEHVAGPDLLHLPVITAEEREHLIASACSLNHFVEEADRKPEAGSPDNNGDLRPGDDFNRRGPDWQDLLGPHGWEVTYQAGGVRYWRRPGKDGRCWSATTGFCKGKDGADLFHVFSSNAEPFRQRGSYSKWRAFALLEHCGDFKAAARDLAKQGYGSRNGRPKGKSPRGVDDHPDAASDDGEIHLTDLGNARRVVERHGADLRFVHPWKTWLVWDGVRWSQDTTAEAVRRVKETLGALYDEATVRLKELPPAGKGGDDENAAERVMLLKLIRHALKWEDARAISRSLELARSEPGIPLLPGDLDRDPFLLNVLNGTLDLRKGELRPHRREDFITKLAPVRFDPQAQCPRWLKFLDRIMAGNRDLITYLQRLVGHGMTGDVSEQCLWFFHGGGANGKSTFLLTILAMLGDYAMQAVSDLLMEKKNESHPTERADLFGKRFVATIETEEGKRMAEALMKQITGGDRVRARKLYKDFFEFEPTHKIVLAANHKPAIRGTDHAAWRRIKLMPFAVTIPEEEKDKALPAKLKAELPGILNWALKGCLDWQAHGMGEPEEVMQATDLYRAEQDTVEQFLTECCVRIPEARVKVAALFETYGKWSGDKFTTQPKFNERLRAKGYASNRESSGYYWHGIGMPASQGAGDGYEPV